MGRERHTREKLLGWLTRHRYILILFLLYYLISGLVLYFLSDSGELSRIPRIDEKTNMTLADQLLTDQISPAFFYQEPGPYFYFALLKTLGLKSAKSIKVFQLLFLNALILWILYLTVLEVKPAYAVLAAAIYGLSPVALFLSATVMKTTATTLLYSLTVLAFVKYYRYGKVRWGIGMVLFMWLSWTFRQHIILFIPVLFFLPIRKPAQSKRRWISLLLLLILIAAIIFTVSSVSKITGKEMLTLTTNGGINFYLSNHHDYERIVNTWPGPTWTAIDTDIDYQRIDPLEFVKADPLSWGLLLIKKGFWEFTPYPEFRIYNWETIATQFPYFKIAVFYRLVVIALVLILPLFWKGLTPIIRGLWICWALFHSVNILFIPGIARYNAIILPISALLAIQSIMELYKNRKPLFLLFPLMGVLLFSRSPNDFKQEFYHYLSVHDRVFAGETVDFKIPKESNHLQDWRLLSARNHYNGSEFKQALTLLKTFKGEPSRFGTEYCETLEGCYYKLGLYYDALKINSLFAIAPNWPEKRRKVIRFRLLFSTEQMIASYKTHNLLNLKTRAEIVTFILKLPPPRHWEEVKRFKPLLRLGLELAREATVDERTGNEAYRLFKILETRIKKRLADSSP